jgi:flavin reductase (DIM6/NTAB) family NADH-FMN oxidoreductase RutF
MNWNRVDPAKVHRLFYPQVPVIVTVERKGRVGAMPAIWCMPLSFKPPLIGLAIAPEHETYNMILETRAFAVNWLDYSYADQVGELGEISGKEYGEKLAAVGLTAVKDRENSQPLIQEASAVLECRTLERYRTGTHELIIAEVLSAYAADSFSNYWDFSQYNPLLYSGTVMNGKKSWIFMSPDETSKRVSLKHESQ